MKKRIISLLLALIMALSLLPVSVLAEMCIRDSIGQGVVNDLALEAVHLGHGLALVVSRHLNGVVAVLQQHRHRCLLYTSTTNRL